MKPPIPTLVLALGLTIAQTTFAQVRPAPGEPPAGNENVEILHVQGNVWLLAGAGGNIAVQEGEQGVIVVDTGAVGLTDSVIAAIASISDHPIRYIINTSIALQHVGGNAMLASLPGGSTSGSDRGAMISVIAQENLFAKMSRPQLNGEPLYPVAAWPSDGYYEPQRGMIFNGEAIDIIHMPNAHSDGDSVVYFRGSNVLVPGDIYTNTSLPMIDYAEGGTYAGMLTALNRMLDIAVPDDFAEGGTYIIPGHGYVADEADLVEYRDMTYIVRDRLRQMVINDGLTLDQVKAERPLLGWEGRYDRPEWTVEMFIEAVYDEFLTARAN
jgi:glyoxylase-like metal-dependent hydrolase (beta-lactamase superfamily II)